MTHATPIETTNLDQCGDTAISWEPAFDLLVSAPDQPETSFSLSTVRPDATPHYAPLGALGLMAAF